MYMAYIGRVCKTSCGVFFWNTLYNVENNEMLRVQIFEQEHTCSLKNFGQYG